MIRVTNAHGFRVENATGIVRASDAAKRDGFVVMVAHDAVPIMGERLLPVGLAGATAFRPDDFPLTVEWVTPGQLQREHGPTAALCEACEGTGLGGHLDRQCSDCNGTGIEDDDDRDPTPWELDTSGPNAAERDARTQQAWHDHKRPPGREG
jgi:hypothetical protein